MKTVSDEDIRFLERFENCQMTAAEFGHREHLQVAYIYLSRAPFDLAAIKMKQGLHGLLAHLGAPPSTFHETLTHAWLRAVFHFIQSTGPTSNFASFLDQGGDRLLDKNIMGTHYSPELLLSEQARKRFMEPDRDPIPAY